MTVWARHFRLGFLALAFFFASEDPAISATKLAVWGTPAQQDATACLIAELSKDPDAYTVLEREQLDRVIAEPVLQAQGLTLAKATEAARLLGASGVLWVEGGNVKGRPVVITRLSAVSSGVVVGWQIDDAPLPDPAGWAKLTAERVRVWRAKLDVARDRAVPISLVDIRSATDSAIANESGQTLRSLLGVRLTAQPELFVLERWRMEELGWENVLAGDAFPAFWNGSWLLDGSVTEAGGKVELSMRLRAADGKETRWMRQGSDKDLIQLVKDVTSDVLARLPADRTQSAWDSQAEAKEFFAEAEWATRWGLSARALESSEAAIALGLNSVAIQRLRYHACGRLAERAIGDFHNICYAHRMGYRVPKMPDELTIERSLRALELFNDLRNSAAGSELLARPPGNFGLNPTLAHQDSVQLLSMASTVLWCAYFSIQDGTSGLSPQLVRLRGAARALFDREFSLIANELHPQPPDRLPPVDRGQTYDGGMGRYGPLRLHTLYLIGLVFGPLWAETCADHELLVRKLLENRPDHPRRFYDDICQTIAFGEVNWAVDWKTHDPHLAVANWVQFFRGLLREKPPCLRIAASLWLLSPPTKGSEERGLPSTEELVEEFFAPFVDHFDDLTDGRLPSQYFVDAIHKTAGKLPNASREKLVNALVVALARPGVIPVSLVDLITNPPIYPENKERLGAVLTKKLSTYGPEVIGTGADQQKILACLKMLGVEIKNLLPPKVIEPVRIKPMVRQSSVDALAAWLEPDGEGICFASLIDDELWVITTPPLVNRYTLGRINLPDMRTEKILTWEPEKFEFLGDQFRFPGFAILAGYLYTWENKSLCRRKIEGGQKELIPLPITQLPKMWAVDGRLYLGLHDGGVLRVDPATNAWDLLADSKRRPAQGVLDDREAYQVENIWQDPRHGLSIIIDSVYSFDETSRQWRGSERFEGWKCRKLYDRALALESLYAVAGACGEHPHFTIDILVSDVGRTGVMDGRFDAGAYFGGEPYQSNGQNQWTVLGGMVEKKDLWIFFHHPCNYERAPHLVWMPELPEQTVTIEVKFPKEALAKIPVSHESLLGGYASGDRVRMILSPHGLAFYTCGNPALWFIPRAELAAAGVTLTNTR